MKAEKDKLIKYLDLAHEVVEMWSVNLAIFVSIVVTANGLLSKRDVACELGYHCADRRNGQWPDGQEPRRTSLEALCRWMDKRPDSAIGSKSSIWLAL